MFGGPQASGVRIGRYISSVPAFVVLPLVRNHLDYHKKMADSLPEMSMRFAHRIALLSSLI